MLSKKTRYAMLALAHLAREYGNGPILIGDIARNENIPQRFLEGILLEMKKNGILGSRLGKAGGYYLIESPENVKLSDIVRHFEGAIALLPCVSVRQYQSCEFCKNESACKIKRVFKEIRDETDRILINTSLKDLI